MRRDSILFLLAGFIVGYFVVFTWTNEKAPELVRAMPQAAPAGSQRPSAPPVDLALVEGLQERVRQNPSDVAALVELGNINFDQMNFGEAIRWYERALEVQPGDANLHADLGTTYFYEQRVDEAIAEFRRALDLDPTHSQAMFNMGVAMLHGKNDPDGALEWWERLVETHPDSPRMDLVREQIALLKEQLQR